MIAELTVILGIALINLFFGFSAARLFGRGPQSWSDLDSVIEFRTFSPRELLFRSSRFLRWPRRVRSDGESQPNDTLAVSDGRTKRVADNRSTQAAETGTPSEPNRLPPSVQGGTVKLAPRPVEKPAETLPCNVVLEQQLKAWQQGEMSDSAACAAMLAVIKPSSSGEAELRQLVLSAIHTKIVDQVRRDRQVVSPREDRFVWFLDDMDANDALLPIERIRQMIGKTRYVHQDQPVDVSLQLVLVASLPADGAAQLLQRLEAACEFACESSAVGVAMDLGEGARIADSIELEIHETEQVL